jgi:hypothetical protein
MNALGGEGSMDMAHLADQKVSTYAVSFWGVSLGHVSYQAFGLYNRIRILDITRDVQKLNTTPTSTLPMQNDPFLFMPLQPHQLSVHLHPQQSSPKTPSYSSH